MKLLLEKWRKYLKEEKLPGTNVILLIKPSPIHGLGVFSGEHIPKGTDLGIAQIKQDTDHEITPLGKHHNHSSEPSCVNVSNGNERHLVTARDLEPDEEITINYVLQPDLEQPLEDWV